MKKYIKNILPAAALLLSMGMSSCVGDLDVTPIDPNKNTNPVSDQLLNKCYANFALVGQNGPDGGDCDVDGLDGGTTGFVRQLFNVNELPTDEAIQALKNLIMLPTTLTIRWLQASITVFISA